MHTAALTASLGLHCGEIEHAMPQLIDNKYKNGFPGGSSFILADAGVRRDAGVTFLFTFLSTARAWWGKCLFAARVTAGITMLDIKSEN